MNLLFKNATLALGEDFRVVKGNLRVENGIIAEIGDAGSPHANDEVIDASHFLIVPGFVNAHLHSTHAFSKGLTDGVTWSEGLRRLYALDIHKNDRDRFWSSLLAFAEGALTGTTTVSVLTSSIEGERVAAENIGIRAVLSKAYHDVWNGQGQGPRLTRLEDIENDFERLYGEGRSELVNIHIGIGTETAASRELFLLTKDIAETYRVRVHMHTAEHREMVRNFRVLHGKHPVLYFRDCEFLGPYLTLIHMTQIHRADVLDALAASGARIVNCPVANAKLTDGILPLKELRRRNVIVGLGTDASMNNNTNNMLSEMYAATLLHNLQTNDPSFLTARDVLRMATIDAARAIGLDEVVGTIEVGKRADLAIFDMDSPAFTPSYDPISNLVFNAPDVRARHTMVNGAFIVKDYTLVTSDLAQIVQEVNSLAEKIHNAAERFEPLARTKKVYVAGAFNHAESESTKAFMRRIGESLEKAGYTFLAPYSIADPEKAAGVSPEEILEFDEDCICEADAIVAYVGVPSLGVGMEIMLARRQQKPVILVFEKDRKISRMVLGAVPSHLRVEFDTPDDAFQKIVEKLNEVI